MPNRVIRESLLNSDRWIGLRDNTGRVCFVALLLTADDVGNCEASTIRLRRLWRDYGVDTDEKVIKTLAELVDSDLVRMYEVIHKQHLHIPRFRQFLRNVKRRFPGSPWDDNEKIQDVLVKTQRVSTADATLPRSESNRIESKSNESNRITGPLAKALDNIKTGLDKTRKGETESESKAVSSSLDTA